MMKMKLFTVVLAVLGAGIVVSAAEVINIDLNGYNDDTPYVGNGAYDVGNNTVWTVYYGGFGIPIGSEKTEALVGSGVPAIEQFYSSVYAAQVWIGDPGQNHTYQSGTALMDDGFVRTAGEPNIALFGEGAYQGVYDIYVYGNAAGTFKLGYYGTVTSQPVTGDAAPGQFELGKNYVVFDNVNINTGDSSNIYIAYTNVINGLQLVKQKDPCVIEPNSLGLIRIPAGDWDVAGERNTRTTEGTKFGPDTWFDDVNGIGRVVGYLDRGEFMEYDINVDEANEGRYEISLGVMGHNTYGFITANTTRIYLDNRDIGEVNHPAIIPAGTIEDANGPVFANLYEGRHTVGWFINSNEGNSGFSLAYVKFKLIGDPVIGNCADIVNYGFALVEDLNGDCVVDLEDLYLATDDWVSCNNPDPSLCF